jgi:pimeloyl-ACP methyl ester carboxylesterase
MDPLTTDTLKKAAELIRAGKQAEARVALMPIVKQNPDSAEVWYLLGFALSDKGQKLYAFQQVLRINPQNEHARKQIANLESPPASAQSAIQEPATRKTPAFTIDFSMPAENVPAFVIDQPTPKSVLKELEPAPLPPPAPPTPTTTTPEPEKKTEEKPAKKKSNAFAWIMVTTLIVLIAVAGFGGWWLVNNGGLFARAAITDEPTAAIQPTDTPPPQTPTILPSPTPQFTAKLKPANCEFDIPLGVRVKCGVVSVPQNRAKNFTDLIDLPLVVYHSANNNSGRAIVYLQGGPGAESLDWALGWFDVFVRPLLESSDVIIFDPRGTGRSSPRLDCPELNDIFRGAYFQNVSEQEAYTAFLNTWSTCHDRFISEGIDPAAFNTTQSAADVNDIVQALGYEQVDLIGISYGTRVALTIMRDYPGIVRSVVLDSPVPMEAKMINQRVDGIDYAINRIFDNCKASPACHSAYPDLKNVFTKLVRRFDSEPVSLTAYDPNTKTYYDVKVNGTDLISAITWSLHTSYLLPVIPKAIYDVDNGDYTFLSFALGIPAAAYSSIDIGTYISTNCHEQIYATTPEALNLDLTKNPLYERYALAEFFGDTNKAFDVCKAWGAAPYDPIDSQPVVSNIPALILSGEYDPTTPVSDGQMIANDLPNDSFFIVPGIGHGATVNSPCAMTITLNFFDNPDQTPDSTCLTQAQDFQFFTPYTGGQPLALEPFDNIGARMQMLIPVEWNRNAFSTYFYRKAYLYDQTQIGLENFTTTKEFVVTALAQSFENNGFDKPLAKFATHPANGFTWTIYTSTFNGEPVFVAIAQVGKNRTTAIVMITSGPEREAFYENLFMPVVNATVPIQ